MEALVLMYMFMYIHVHVPIHYYISLFISVLKISLHRYQTKFNKSMTSKME